MEVKINVELKVGSDKYEVELLLPGSTPTAEAPFLFDVNQINDPKKKDSLLQVAVGGTGHIRVAVKPPKNLIEKAGAGDVLEKLEVVVAEGSFNTEKRNFAAIESQA